jgi:DnaA family protein
MPPTKPNTCQQGRPTQLLLGVGLDDDATFENFLVAPANQQLVDYLRAAAANRASEQFIYLWGGPSSGRTHLLQAMCHELTTARHSSIYLPLKELANFAPAIFQGANTLSLVCLDDLDCLAGDAAWEAALFNAFNEIQASATQLIICGNCAPQGLQIKLPDLASRLQSGLTFQLTELNDTDKRIALQLRAGNRGMELGNAVADYIIARAERSLKALMQILDRLDESSIKEQRKLTIPFVKSTLGL